MHASSSIQYELLGRKHSTGMGRPRRRSQLTCLVVLVLILGVTLTCLNIYQLDRIKADNEIHMAQLARLPEVEAQNMEHHQRFTSGNSSSGHIVWIQGSPRSNNNGPSGYLKHVYNVFYKLGFTVVSGKEGNLSDWLVLWSHDYPFVSLGFQMKALQPYHKVNHWPGLGYITNKVSLAQTQLDVIPKAFELPRRKQEFLKYATEHPETTWVQKSNKHRGIKVKALAEVDLSQEGTFVQQFMANPFLIDGRKFDIGVYTVLTSVNPLRVYTIDGDALFRFCPEEYYPFDSTNLDKYVVGDDYRPMWQQPSLENLYTDNEFTFTNTFNEHLRQRGKEPNIVWSKMKAAVRKVFLSREPDLITALSNYKSKRNFFEMVRFDFVIDEDLRVFLMEANMSPNLSSDHFPPNARLYEHAISNLLSLVGVTHLKATSNPKTKHTADEPTSVSSRDIRVFPEYCNSKVCGQGCKKLFVCGLCRKCLTHDLELDLRSAYLEHTRRGSARRVFPPPITYVEAIKISFEGESELHQLKGLSQKNKLMYLWFIGKCRLDRAWCF